MAHEMDDMDKTKEENQSNHPLVNPILNLAKTGLDVLKFGAEHAGSLAEIARDTLVAHKSESAQNQEQTTADGETGDKEEEEPEIVTQVIDKKIVLSENVLLKELQKLQPHDKWKIAGLSCLTDKMTVVCDGQWLGMDATATIDLRLENLVVKDDAQSMMLSVEALDIRTTGFWRKLAWKLLSPFKPFGLRKALMKSRWKECIGLLDDGRRIRVDLSALPIIDRLCRPQIASLEKTAPLHLIGIKGAGHEAGGIAVYLSMSETIKKIVKKAAPIIREAGKTVLNVLRKL